MGEENPQGGNVPASNGTQGESENNENHGTPHYVTSDQLNKAITYHLKQFDKKNSQTLNDKFEELKTLLSGNSNSGGNEEGSEEPNQNAGKGKSAEPKVDTETLRLKKQIDDLTKRLEVTEQAKNAEAQKAKQVQVKNEVLKALSELKVEKGEQVYQLVRDRLLEDELGSVKIKVLDPLINIEDEKDLKSGLSDWLNTEGTHFLPARNTSGSGASGTGSGQRRSLTAAEISKMSPKELANKPITELLDAETLSNFRSDYNF